MKITNFRNYVTPGREKAFVEVFATATVDVTTGVLWWEKTETKDVARRVGGGWYFADTGRVAPKYLVEGLENAYLAEVELVEWRRMPAKPRTLDLNGRGKVRRGWSFFICSWSPWISQGMGVDEEYKKELLHSIELYRDQIFDRPEYAAGEGWDDLEALQQVTIEDSLGRWFKSLASSASVDT